MNVSPFAITQIYFHAFAVLISRYAEKREAHALFIAIRLSQKHDGNGGKGKKFLILSGGVSNSNQSKSA